MGGWGMKEIMGSFLLLLLPATLRPTTATKLKEGGGAWLEHGACQEKYPLFVHQLYQEEQG